MAPLEIEILLGILQGKAPLRAPSRDLRGLRVEGLGSSGARFRVPWVWLGLWLPCPHLLGDAPCSFAHPDKTILP